MTFPFSRSATYYTSGSISSSTGAFLLAAGRYLVSAHADTWNSATFALEIQGPDGTTNYIPVMTPMTADATVAVDLPDGQFKGIISGSPTALFFSVVRIQRGNP